MRSHTALKFTPGRHCSIRYVSRHSYMCPPGSTTPIASQCPSGRYSLSGASTCSACAAGTFGVAAAMTSVICTGLCPVGQFSTAGSTTCSACPAGSFGNSTGLTTSACSGYCPPGYACPMGSTAITMCPAGQYSGAAAATCSLCGPGLFGTLPGQVSSATACTGVCGPAAPGYYCGGQGASSAFGTPCPSGQYSPTGSNVSCTACAVGRYSTGGAVSCNATTVSSPDRLGLVNLFTSTNGPSWTGPVVGWSDYGLPSADPCYPAPWTGLSCEYWATSPTSGVVYGGRRPLRLLCFV